MMCSSKAAATPLAQVTRVGSHGLQFADAVGQFLQCADTGQIAALPDRPHGNVGRPQTRQVERENMPRRGVGVHSPQMQSEQRLRRGAGEIVLTNVEHHP